MQTSILELPRSMVAAARTYAERENRTVVELFADLMKSRYGFTMTFSVDAPVMTHKRSVPIPDSIKSISGIITLPVGKTEDEVIYEAIMSK